jgi:formylglycine-generating enzyme required for sulfatase activity
MQTFALGRTEVTVAQFRRFIESTGYRTDAEGQLGGCLGGIDEISPTGQYRGKWAVRKGETWRRSAIAQDATHPVVCVSFRDAAAYAEWLSKQTGEAYRLPNEAEWEYAARAGTTTPYSTGNCLSAAQANITDVPLRSFANCPSFTSFKGTKPVASYAPNPFGVYDMYGNAEEWTADCWHEDYQQAPQDGRAWMSENRGDCRSRPTRGGSWQTTAMFARAGYRAPAYVHAGDYETGFRLARTL